MKYAVVLQHSESDCGAACLGAIAKHYGLTLTLNRLREVVGTGQQGTTLLGLQRGADALGFNARTVRAAPQVLDRLQEAPLPAIIHWQGTHWVVFYGQEKTYGQAKKSGSRNLLGLGKLFGRGKDAGQATGSEQAKNAKHSNQHYVIADPAVGVRYVSEAELRKGWADWVMLLLEPDPARFSTETGSDRPKVLQNFFRRVWSYRALLLQVLVINIALGFLSIATPFLIQILTDDVLVRGDLKLLNTIALSVMVLILFSSSLGFVQANLTAYFAQRLELGLVQEFGRAILNLPLTYYETHRSGEIVSRLRDIQALNQLVSQIVIGLPSQVFIALVSLGFMVAFSGKLTLAAIALATLMTLSTLLFLPTLQQKTRTLLVQDADNQGVLVETFKGALTLKTTAAGSQFWEELQGRFGRLANLSFRTNQIGIVNTVFSSLVSGIGGIGLLWFGSALVIGKEISIGQLLAFSSFNGNFTSLISTLIKFVDEFARVKTATERLTEVIEHHSELENQVAKPSVKLPANGAIACSQLSFHYPGRTDLLNEFSLTIPGGKVVALIGKSGCGKSSLAKLLAGLYELQSGNIRIGQYNLADLSLECVRQQVVLIPQEPHFWSRSIIENFRLGAPDLTFEAIVKVCQITGADEFISRLPEKYQTVLGEFGANLSGGQRQRLAIARALLTNPPILILDESTANLDPESEAEVLDQLLAYRQGKTTLLISHRPQVIQRAEWLVVLDQGKLASQGTPADLRATPEIYLHFLQDWG
jgi:ATP-binding cassette subfamily C protein